MNAISMKSGTLFQGAAHGREVISPKLVSNIGTIINCFVLQGRRSASELIASFYEATHTRVRARDKSAGLAFAWYCQMLIDILTDAEEHIRAESFGDEQRRILAQRARDLVPTAFTAIGVKGETQNAITHQVDAAIKQGFSALAVARCNFDAEWGFGMAENCEDVNAAHR